MPEASRPKHVPVRMCVVCREKAGKRTLMRVVRTADGVQVDPSGKMDGRGAYLCDQDQCWERAMTSDVLAKALRTSITQQDRVQMRTGRAGLLARATPGTTERDTALGAQSSPPAGHGKSRP